MRKSCGWKLDSRAMQLGVSLLLSVLTAFVAYGRTEYFVDCTRPDDSGDGRSVETAKRTIQAAVDLTSPAGTDIVTVLPGVYNEGSRVITTSEFDHEFRVVITNQLLLRSRDGAAATVIKGAFGSGADHLGPGAIRGIYMRTPVGSTAQSYTAIEGFTITGCATTNTVASGSRHYGAAVVGSWNQYVLGCVISNNHAVSGAGIFNCNAARCLFTVNKASTCAVGVNAYYWNCVIAGNKGSVPLSYTKNMVNCTCTDNDGALGGGCAQTFDNCVLVGNGGANGSSSYTELTCSVTESASSAFKTVDGVSVTGASKYQLVAPAFGDWRLVEGSGAVGIASWSRYYNFVTAGQKLNVAVNNGYLPSYILTEYLYKDYAGNGLSDNMTMDAGAIQRTVAVDSGVVDFLAAGFVGRGWSVPCRINSYAHAEKWPSLLVCKIVNASGMPTFGCKVTGSYVASNHSYMYPDLDGWFTFAFPPKGSKSELTPYTVQRIYYVDDDGSDGNAGDAPDRAFKTLQMAADTVKANGGNYNLVSVAPGVYNEGGTFAKGLTNRLCVSGQSIQFYAPGGPDVTFIEGAPSPGSAFHGLGPNATRCLYWYSSHAEAAMRGFTFRNGYSSHTDGDKWSVTDANQAGGVFVFVEGGKVQFLDCVFTNNTALIAAVNNAGDFTRCRFIKNRALNASGSIGRNGTYRFCSFWGNGPGTFVLDNSVQTVYFCSIDGRATPYQSNIYGTVNVNPGVASDPIHSSSKSYDGNVLAPGCTVSVYSGCTDCTLNYISADPQLVDVDAGDMHLLVGSPALGAADVANITSILHQVTLDLDGNEPNFVDGIMTAGAYQVPSMLFTVGGREGAVQVEGGAFGRNALRPGSTITVTAAERFNGRRFAGFLVDGEPMPATERVFSYTVPPMPTVSMTVETQYAPVGTMMVLR